METPLRQRLPITAQWVWVRLMHPSGKGPIKSSSEVPERHNALRHFDKPKIRFVVPIIYLGSSEAAPMKSHMTRLKSLPSLQPSNDATNRSRGQKSNEGPDAHPRELEVVDILRPSQILTSRGRF